MRARAEHFAANEYFLVARSLNIKLQNITDRQRTPCLSAHRRSMPNSIDIASLKFAYVYMYICVCMCVTHEMKVCSRLNISLVQLSTDTQDVVSDMGACTRTRLSLPLALI
jgi:hypothetical protein